MSDRDEHLEVLRAMWGEMKTLNSRITTGLAELREDLGGRIDATNARLDVNNARLEATNERLDSVIVELRASVGLSHLDRRRLDRLEQRVEALEQDKR